MEKLLKMSDEISQVMKEKGYQYFNVKYGGIGTDFKTGIETYLCNTNIPEGGPVFPIYAVSGVAATSPDNPYSWATFTIIEDAQKGLRIDSMNISMYECHDGALRTSLDLKIKSLADIPSKQNAAKLIEEKWEKLYQGNREKNNKPLSVRPKVRKLR